MFLMFCRLSRSTACSHTCPCRPSLWTWPTHTRSLSLSTGSSATPSTSQRGAWPTCRARRKPRPLHQSPPWKRAMKTPPLTPPPGTPTIQSLLMPLQHDLPRLLWSQFLVASHVIVTSTNLHNHTMHMMINIHTTLTNLMTLLLTSPRHHVMVRTRGSVQRRAHCETCQIRQGWEEGMTLAQKVISRCQVSLGVGKWIWNQTHNLQKECRTPKPDLVWEHWMQKRAFRPQEPSCAEIPREILYQLEVISHPPRTLTPDFSAPCRRGRPSSWGERGGNILLIWGEGKGYSTWQFMLKLTLPCVGILVCYMYTLNYELCTLCLSCAEITSWRRVRRRTWHYNYTTQLFVGIFFDLYNHMHVTTLHKLSLTLNENTVICTIVVLFFFNQISVGLLVLYNNDACRLWLFFRSCWGVIFRVYLLHEIPYVLLQIVYPLAHVIQPTNNLFGHLLELLLLCACVLCVIC